MIRTIVDAIIGYCVLVWVFGGLVLYVQTKLGLWDDETSSTPPNGGALPRSV